MTKLIKNMLKNAVASLLLLYSVIAFADPNCTNLGRLFYVGRSGNHSFWLTISRASIKNAQLQGPAGQIVDNFTMSPKQLHLSASPFLGFGAAGQHTLFNIKNNGPCFIDSAQQTPRPPELPGFPDGGDPGDGIDGSGNSVLNQILLNVNKNFLTTYVSRSYSVSERVDNAFLRCEDEILNKKWQIWIEPQYTGLNSKVATGSPDINSRVVQFGASYNLNEQFLIGLSALGNNSIVYAFSDSLINQNQGLVAGPYFGLKFYNTILDAWFIYGYNDINSDLLGLKGNFNMKSLMASCNASALFDIYKFILQPKLSFFYSRNRTEKFNYTGIIPNNNVNVVLRVRKDQFEYARASFTTKLFQEIILNDAIVIPSLTAGVNNNFVLPDHGHVLNSQLQVTSISPWSGIVQAGIGAKLYEALRMDFVAGYYSIGLKENLWNVGFTVTLGI